MGGDHIGRARLHGVAANMIHSVAIFAFALLFMIMGVAELTLFKAALYPSLRWRYERAKASLSHGIKPEFILNLMRVQCLFILPLIGIYLALRIFPVVN